MHFFFFFFFLEGGGERGREGGGGHVVLIISVCVFLQAVPMSISSTALLLITGPTYSPQDSIFLRRMLMPIILFYSRKKMKASRKEARQEEEMKDGRKRLRGEEREARGREC